MTPFAEVIAYARRLSVEAEHDDAIDALQAIATAAATLDQAFHQINEALGRLTPDCADVAGLLHDQATEVAAYYLDRPRLYQPPRETAWERALHGSGS